MVGWGDETVFASTNHLVTVFNIYNNSSLQYNQNGIITCLFMNPAYCVTGDKYGMLEYRQVKTCKSLYSINKISYTLAESDIILGHRINKINLLFQTERVLVVAAHEGFFKLFLLKNFN